MSILTSYLLLLALLRIHSCPTVIRYTLTDGSPNIPSKVNSVPPAIGPDNGFA